MSICGPTPAENGVGTGCQQDIDKVAIWRTKTETNQRLLLDGFQSTAFAAGVLQPDVVASTRRRSGFMIVGESLLWED